MEEQAPKARSRTPASRLGATGRATTDPEIEENEAQFRELLAHLKQVFWTKSADDARVLYISPAYETIWGRSRSTLYDNSHTFLDSIHPDDRARMAGVMSRKHETEGYNEEYRILRPDGTTRWIWGRTYPVRDEHGEITRYAGIAEDMSERKWSETERSRLAALIEHSEDTIVSITPDGTIVAWNHGAERKYGYTAEEVIGHSVLILVPPDHRDEYWNIMRRVMNGEAVPTYDTVRIKKDGTLISLSVGISPIETRDGKIVGMSKISHDITRVRKLEFQLIEAQKMEVLGQLTSGVAHDFNNIIAVILGYSEMLLEELGPEHVLHRRVLAIRHAAERGGGLTRQLLIFSRKETVQFALINLNEVVKTMDGMMRQIVAENIELIIAPGTKIGRVKADIGYAGQVLMNLVVNARDAMPGGGTLRIATSDVVLDAAYAAEHPGVCCGDYVMLSVSDTGTGMSKEIQLRIFEPLFTTKPPGEGTGLGLATCQIIVQKSGGHIGLRSEVGKGSTFEIFFPRVDEEPFASASSLPDLSLARGSETLLVVEDDLDVRHLLCTVLRRQGYRVLAANNGDHALRAVNDDGGPPVALVITDVIMPLMGGKAMVERLTAKDPCLRVLFTSGHLDETIAPDGVLNPEIAFLRKPYSIAALIRKVRELLDAPALR